MTRAGWRVTDADRISAFWAICFPSEQFEVVFQRVRAVTHDFPAIRIGPHRNNELLRPAGRPWTRAEVAQLHELIAAGVKIGLIARKLKRLQARSTLA
jgi:hypothetical protein